MKHTEKRQAPLKKVCLGILLFLLAAVIILGGVIFATWHNEIATLMSFQQIRERDDDHQDGSVYSMEVKGGYYLEEFIAQGGVKSDSELIQFVTEKITKGLIPMTIEESEIACSSFTAVTEEGDWLFARNYDFSKTNTCLVFTEASGDRHATISTVDLQFLGLDVDSDVESLIDKITCLAAPYIPLDGINDAGVSCGIYMTYQGEETVATDQNTEKPDITSTTMLRLILDYADDIEEAIELVSAYDLHDSAKTSYHYMVADATGRSAILEWVYGTDLTDNDGSMRQLVVTYSDDDAYIGEEEGDAAYQWITNFILQPGYYEDDSEKKGLDRYEQLYEELKATDGVVADEQAAMDILATVGRRSWKNDDGNGCTVHSVVYNLTDKSVMWIPNEHYDDPAAVLTFRLGQ